MSDKYDIFALGYDQDLNKIDDFYGSGLPINIIDGLNPILLGSGDMAGNISLTNGYMQSADYDSGVAGWRITATGDVEFNEGTFRGTVEVGSLHIPDEDTTADSFHTDTTGNSWWGCTQSDFTSDNNNADAYILKTGVAKFQDITINGSTLSNKPIYGDGSDGAVTISGNTDLSRDMYYTNLTISGGDLNCNGWRVFVNGTLTINSGRKIHRDGSDGNIGTNGADGNVGQSLGGVGGSAGTNQTDRMLSGGWGGAGRPAGGGQQAGDGSDANAPADSVAGTNGSHISVSLCSEGKAGGAGGDARYIGGSAQNGSAGGSAGGRTASNSKPRTVYTAHFMTEFYTPGSLAKYEGGGSSGQGGGGGAGHDWNNCNGGGSGGGGGAGGNCGGIVLIAARTIVNNGTISAAGGAGGIGGDGGDGIIVGADFGDGGGGGGGGGGGCGGVLALIYNSLTNNGTISVAGGSGGTGGDGGLTGHGTFPADDGVNGATGNGGFLVQLEN